ncbi:hypothetical protein ACH4Q6_08715 [Streptomyces lydicus]|uniref:hypothetical protein n=1 Tax=Streptomyces lydicus TaxID=47763 RepID=UPI0037A1A1E4
MGRWSRSSRAGRSCAGSRTREGLGLEDFYRRPGRTEVGRWPGALRLAPGDDRDEILMALDLRTAG